MCACVSHPSSKLKMPAIKKLCKKLFGWGNALLKNWPKRRKNCIRLIFCEFFFARFILNYGHSFELFYCSSGIWEMTACIGISNWGNAMKMYECQKSCEKLEWIELLLKWKNWHESRVSPEIQFRTFKNNEPNE